MKTSFSTYYNLFLNLSSIVNLGNEMNSYEESALLEKLIYGTQYDIIYWKTFYFIDENSSGSLIKMNLPISLAEVYPIYSMNQDLIMMTMLLILLQGKTFDNTSVWSLTKNVILAIYSCQITTMTRPLIVKGKIMIQSWSSLGNTNSKILDDLICSGALQQYSKVPKEE